MKCMSEGATRGLATLAAKRKRFKAEGLNAETTPVVVVCRPCVIAYQTGYGRLRYSCARCGKRGLAAMLWTEWETYQSEHNPGGEANANRPGPARGGARA